MDGRRALQVVLGQNTIDFQASRDKSDPNSILLMCQDDGSGGPVAFGKPMVKFRVLSLDEKTHCLAIGLSHAQYDGMCLRLILSDIRTAYLHQPLPDRPCYSTFIRYTLRTNNTDAELFWQTALRDSTMTSLVSRILPSDRHLLLSREERQICNPPSRVQGITFSTILKAAWSLVLAQFCGRSDIVFGNLISGRNAPIEAVEEMVGPCMNIIPIRVRLDQNWTYNDLLNHLRTQQSAMIAFETMPFADIVEKCTQWPKSTRFGSILQHQNLPAMTTQGKSEPGELAWETVGSMAYPGLCDEVDSWICSVPHENHTTIGLRYNDRALPSLVASKLLDSLCTTIMDIFENTDKNIASAVGMKIPLPLLPMHASSTSTSAAASKETPLNHQILSALRNMWKEVLLSDSLTAESQSATHDVDVNFFEIGGDSVAAAQLADACAKNQLQVTIQDVFDYPTLRLQTLLVSRTIERAHPVEREGNNVMFWE